MGMQFKSYPRNQRTPLGQSFSALLISTHPCYHFPARAAITKDLLPQSGWCKQQKYVVSQSGSLTPKPAFIFAQYSPCVNIFVFKFLNLHFNREIYVIVLQTLGASLRPFEFGRSVTHSCPALCNPMVCSMSGFPVLHHHLELAQTHVHWDNNAI